MITVTPSSNVAALWHIVCRPVAYCVPPEALRDRGGTSMRCAARVSRSPLAGRARVALNADSLQRRPICGVGGGPEPADIEGARSRSHGPAAERPALGLGESEWEWSLITAARHWRSEMQRKSAPCTASAEHSSASTAGSDARYLGKRLDPASGLHAAVA